MPLTPDYIRSEILGLQYQISLNADDERLADALTITDMETALVNCEIIEAYPEDRRGESCLALGFIKNTPFHLFVAKIVLDIWF